MSTASQSHEDAPLLANGGPDDSESDGEQAANGKQSKQAKPNAWLSKAWHWVLNNLMIVFIALLLLGGIIALSVYFAGIS